MINVELLTEEGLTERFDIIPDDLKNALLSELNERITEEVCVNHHLVDAEKIETIKQIIGLVILGFVHYYDIPREIISAGVVSDPRLAESIYKELDVKIFSPIKTALERNYSPIVEKIEVSEGLSAPGFPPLKTFTTPQETTPTMPMRPFLGAETKNTTEAKPGPTSPLPPSLKPEARTKIYPENIVGEFTKLGTEKKTAEEAPKIIHEEPTTPPSKPASSFRLDVSTSKPEESGGGLKSFWPPRPAESEARPSRPAGSPLRERSETDKTRPAQPPLQGVIGPQNKPGSGPAAKKADVGMSVEKKIETPKVVNYTDLRYPLDKILPKKPGGSPLAVPPPPPPPPPRPPVPEKELPRVDTLSPRNGEINKKSPLPPLPPSKEPPTTPGQASPPLIK